MTETLPLTKISPLGFDIPLQCLPAENQLSTKAVPY